jgi:hypothetical protein
MPRPMQARLRSDCDTVAQRPENFYTRRGVETVLNVRSSLRCARCLLDRMGFIQGGRGFSLSLRLALIMWIPLRSRPHPGNLTFLVVA